MTLDEAITHAEEQGCGDTVCAEEHRQLAVWLGELREHRRQCPPMRGTMREAPNFHLEPDELEP